MIKIILDKLLTEEECKNIIQIGDELGYKKPTVKTPEGEMVREDIRNNGSALVDDTELTNTLFNKFKNDLPQEIDGYKLKGLNEQMKVYRYEVGQQFKMHKDVPYRPSNNERSFITMLIYLNEDYKGGETFFIDGNVTAETGKCLLFQQNVLHAGIKVTEGVKYAIRTDVMYEKI